MTSPISTGFDVTNTYVHLPDGGGGIPVDCTPAFWSELASGTQRYEGRLITAYHLSEDMGHWEMHPAGEEVLICISGSAEAVLQRPDGEESIAMSPGTGCIVPRGVWHRLRVHEPGIVMFITPGEGTRHKPM